MQQLKQMKKILIELFPFWKQFKKKAPDKLKRKLVFYEFDMINSVGYQVNLNMAKQFRIWVKQRLKDYFCEYRISS